MQDSNPPASADGKAPPRKRPYNTPSLTEYGSVTSLTAGTGSKGKEAVGRKNE